MTLSKAITLARKHVLAYYPGVMQSSAELCLADAINLMDRGEYPCAARRALSSLSYTVGVFHKDYKAAQSIV